MYEFILNMWVMRRIDENYLVQAVDKKRISEEQKEIILATPQVTK